MSKELTYAEVSAHSGKKDLYLVIHDKVYDSTSFIDEHPGGEEVLLDLGGQDASEAFEDVGHSDEAREILEGLLIGTLKRQPGDPKPSTATATSTTTKTSETASFNYGLYISVLLAGAAAYGAYKFTSTQQGQA